MDYRNGMPAVAPSAASGGGEALTFPCRSERGVTTAFALNFSGDLYTLILDRRKTLESRKDPRLAALRGQHLIIRRGFRACEVELLEAPRTRAGLLRPRAARPLSPRLAGGRRGRGRDHHQA